MKSMRSSILVIGIGNEFRSDDGVGLLVARAIKEKKFPHVAVIEQSGEGAALMDAWNSAQNVYVVDAVSSSAPGGTVFRIDAKTEPLQNDLRLFSSHAFGVVDAVELGRQMNMLPTRLIIFGIGAKNFESGKHLSSGVKRSKQTVTQMLIDDMLSVSPRSLH